MVSTTLFSSAKADWETPQDLFDLLHAEFGFKLDVCANALNKKCDAYWPEGYNALTSPWRPSPCWCNPPYGRKVGDWLAKATHEAQHGTTTVMLLPARTDTKWFHAYVWDREKHTTRPGIEVRFLKGRLKFVGAPAPAPFPSVLVIFRSTKT